MELIEQGITIYPFHYDNNLTVIGNRAMLISRYMIDKYKTTNVNLKNYPYECWKLNPDSNKVSISIYNQQNLLIYKDYLSLFYLTYSPLRTFNATYNCHCYSLFKNFNCNYWIENKWVDILQAVVFNLILLVSLSFGNI